MVTALVETSPVNLLALKRAEIYRRIKEARAEKREIPARAVILMRERERRTLEGWVEWLLEGSSFGSETVMNASTQHTLAERPVRKRPLPSRRYLPDGGGRGGVEYNILLLQSDTVEGGSRKIKEGESRRRKTLPTPSKRAMRSDAGCPSLPSEASGCRDHFR